MFKSIVIAGLCLAAAPWVAAQQVPFPTDGVEDPAALSAAVSKLAAQLLPAYRDADRATLLDNVFRLQIVNGQYTDAEKTLTELASVARNEISPQVSAARVPYAIFLQAKIRQAREGKPFNEVFQSAFRDTFSRLDDRTAARVIRAFSRDPAALQEAIQAMLKQSSGKDALPVADALELIRTYQAADMYGSFAPLVASLIDADDLRRYVIDKDVLISTPDGASVCVMVMRPRTGPARLPTLFDFTVYNIPQINVGLTRRTVSNGYVAVEGLVRGKGCSPDKPVPFEHDSSDAVTVINWISRQPWSDGRVGMWGGSYSGFSQWAAAKQMPKALKALMPMATAAPAIDIPMDGTIFMTFFYPWPLYTTTNKTVDDATYNQSERWNRLNRNWYVSGRAYRDLDKIDGTPNPFFHRWLDHPTYDAYWQAMIPYKTEFAQIRIPVLTTLGYYNGGYGAGVYYLTEHIKYNPAAEHYVVIGPYNHFQAQTGMIDNLGRPTTVSSGYTLDPVALIDIAELRYQWFDYIFKGGAKPDLLKDKMNYQVMGANVWKHAPSIAAMSNQTLRYHLSAVPAGKAYRLTRQRPRSGSLALKVDFADRSDVDRIASGGNIVDKAIDTWNGLEYISDPFSQPGEISGLFSGRLDFIANKRDFDFSIALYELTSNNEYVLLSTYQARASHVGDLVHRRLLTPGKRQVLNFKSVLLTSRQLQAGSRLVVVLGIIKGPYMQINYGTGKDVSDETIADAKSPLVVEWLSDSFIDIPSYQ